MLIPHQPLIRKHSYLISWYHAVMALTPLRLQILEFMPQGGARGQNLGHLRIFKFFFFLLWNHAYLNNRYYLGLTLSMASDLRVQCPQGGARAQNLEYLIIFFFAFLFLLWIHLYLDNMYFLGLTFSL